MGNNHPAEKKHLVIVGASFSGLLLLDKVKNDFNITLIDKKDHFEWICSLPKSVLQRDYFNDDATLDLKQCIEGDRVFGENVQFLQGMLTEVVDQRSIRIKRTDQIKDGETINDVAPEIVNFDYLVICTGTQFKANERDVTSVAHLFTKKQRHDYLEKYAQEIDKAKSILIVGGGPTGTEFLGEIQRKYGQTKTYGLLNSQDQLLVGFPERTGARAYTHFDNNGVNIHTGMYFEPNSDIAKQYDFILMCVGLTCYTPFMDNQEFKDCKDKRGRIYVNEYFQVTNQDPTVESSDQVMDDPKVYDNIFCYGDACVTKMQEVKNVPAIRSTSYTIAHNLKASAYGGDLRSMPYAVDNLAGVYFSRFDGVVVFNDCAIPNPLTLTAKDFIEGTFMNYYKNRRCSRARYNFYNSSVNTMSYIFNNVLCCLSCSNRRATQERRRIVRKVFEQHREEAKKSK